MQSLKQRCSTLAAAALGVALTGSLVGCGSSVPEATNKDYMVAVSRPNHLNVIDAETLEPVNRCDLPAHPAPGTIVMSPDSQIAYTLIGSFGEIYGIDIESCEVVFSANQSQGNERVRSMGAIAISPDGSEIYTHQNPTVMMSDHYQVQDTRVAVFNTADGLDAKAVRTFPAPRQVTIIKTGDDGTLYLGGPDVYAMDVNSGEYTTSIVSRNLDDPQYSPRDVLTVWPIGDTSNEFIRMFSVVKFNGESGDMDNASFHWGYERIDLTTGEPTDTIFGPLEVVLFSGQTRPNHPDQMWAVLSHLKQFDVPSQTEVRSITLDHTYYCINFSTDGDTIYLSGALDDIVAYDANTLEKLGNITLGGDMSMATPRVINRSVITSKL